MAWNRLIYRVADLFLVNQAKRRTLGDAHPSKEPIWFDFHSPKLLFDGARHFNSLALQLVDMGHPVVVIDRNRLALRLARKLHGRAVIQCPSVFFAKSTQSPPPGSTVITDSLSSEASCFSIRVSIGATPVAGASVYPFPVHPTVRSSLTPAQLARGRSRDQRARLFFSGNQKSRYAKSDLSTQFSACNRIDLLGHLRAKFGGLCETLQQWPKQANSVWRPIMLGDSRRVSIHPTQWLDALSHFDFFIGCPGVDHPMCHNLIEAMSVGTIPVLEHGHCFCPHLVDGVNAILFSGLDGFEDAVQRVLAMDDSTIRRLRRGVVEYYDAHLDSEKYLRRLMMSVKLRGGVVLSIPYHHANLDPPPSVSETIASVSETMASNSETTASSPMPFGRASAA